MTEALSVKMSAPEVQTAGLSQWRERAEQQFQLYGLPEKRHEAWKYTNLRTLSDEALATVKPIQAFEYEEPLTHHNVITLADGRYDATTSDLPEVATVVDLTKPLGKDIEAIIGALFPETALTEPSETQLALNLAKAEEALVIHVPRGQVVERPIELHHVMSEAGGSRYSQVWLLMEPDSQLTLLERFYGAAQHDGAERVQNHAAIFELKRGAGLTHHRVQDAPRDSYHIYSEQLTMQSRSEYHAFTLTSGAKVSRHETRAHLLGKQIRCDQQGVTFGNGDQHHDVFLPVLHADAESYSNQRFRQLLDGQSKGIFYGTVHVPESSPKTEAHQLNQNILLSDKAQAYTRPELDIFTDDVVCSHGATVGNLDEQALYYLQTRGLSADAAKRMLTEAFAEDMLEAVRQEPIHDFMRDHVRKVTGQSES